MPELPEVETIVRCLRPRLLGLKIKTIEVNFSRLVRNEDESFLGMFQGTHIVDLRRRGKMILLDCTGGLSLLFHLKMTGQLLLCRGRAPSDKHTHLVISFCDSKKELRFRDVRKFGFVRGVKTAEAEKAPELRDLGPEPFDLDDRGFSLLFRGRRGRLKSLLVDQKAIAGIGNIYADEILFEARLHPAVDISRLHQKELKRLWRAVPLILRRAIDFKGTSIRDFKDGNGEEGSFQDYLRAYGRESLPCLRCGARIKRLRLGGRSSYVCPRCQRAGVSREFTSRRKKPGR